jgi:hypothetical protein
MSFADFIAIIMLVIVSLMLATAFVSLFLRIPYVPSSTRAAKQMIKIAALKKGNIVYDLGCGDGKLLFEAEKTKNITARGFEAAPIPYLLAQLKKWIFGSKATVRMQNFFRADLSDADVIFCYLGTDIMTRLAEKFEKECKKGTKIISNTFQMPSLTPTKVWRKDKKKKLPSIYLYQI